MNNINSVIENIRSYERHGLDIDDMEQIAQKALLESYKCTDTYHQTLMYLMAIDILSTHDDGK